MNFTVKIEI